LISDIRAIVGKLDSSFDTDTIGKVMSNLASLNMGKLNEKALLDAIIDKSNGKSRNAKSKAKNKKNKGNNVIELPIENFTGQQTLNQLQTIL